jgi:glycogen operon protein
MATKTYPIRPGARYPFGATPDRDGVNFCIFSRYAKAVQLLLFATPDSPEPFQVIELDPEVHCTFFSWHVYVEGLSAGAPYAWRAKGPDTAVAVSGFRFDGEKALVDPWARAVTDAHWDRHRAREPERDNTASAIRALAVDDTFDWEGDAPRNLPRETAIIYEVHVGGFTHHPSSGVAHPGTFSGLIEKIPYLKELGVTHVELLPVMAFDEQDIPPGAVERGLKNYWGYATHSYFAPHPAYCRSPDATTHRREFREMVRALHEAGIGVILDVVFNHTAEGGTAGPTINFKGLGNETFYILDPADRSRYLDFTGCGNTVNANHPLVAGFILSCLEHWVAEMHVDGFRFDLASALARGEDGRPQYHAPVLWGIELSRVLAETKLIAEAWDAGGLYQVGDFPGFRWAEWNGRYRDLVRRFVTGEPGLIAELATRLAGSSDLYQLGGRLPINSINFVTCHDGFTLWDLVSYNDKHNEANGEDNRDGADANYSWNCGVEGDTDDPGVLALRRKQAKNLMAILLLSQGVPMILAGDEVLRSQRGNNNGYCQDNELSWLDWELRVVNRDMHRFVRELIALRKRHPCLMRRRFLSGRKVGASGLPDVSWHGFELHWPLWHEPEAKLVAFTLSGLSRDEAHVHVILNMSDQALYLPLPPLEGRRWYRCADTARPSPHDILPPAEQPEVGGLSYQAEARSVVVLEGRSV